MIGRCLTVACCALMAGCSPRAKLLPVNELNEPLFHPTHFYALGAEGGAYWLHLDSAGGITTRPFYRPLIVFDRMVTPNLGFSVWPLYWNFLVSGEQYTRVGELDQGKIHLALHAGLPLEFLPISAHSTFIQPPLFMLAASSKYVINDDWYLGSELAEILPLEDAGSLFSIHEWGDSRQSAQIGGGYQIDEINSVGLFGRVTTYREARLVSGATVRSRRTFKEFWIHQRYYLTPKHVFGSEARLVYDKFGTAGVFYWTLGAQYTFAFD